MVPTLFNADTLGIRPDLVGGRDKVKSWKDLLSPDLQGQGGAGRLRAGRHHGRRDGARSRAAT